MLPLDFVIAALPRSGTRYTSRLFRGLGIQTYHERFFKGCRQIYEHEEEKVVGDVSWYAAPFLDRLPQTTVVLFQKRDMVDTLNSMWGPPGTDGILCLDNPPGRFVKRYCPEVFEKESKEEQYIEFYTRWTALIQNHATVVYDVTDLADPTFCNTIIKAATKQDIPIEDVRLGLTRVQSKDHTRGPNVEWASAYLEELK